jgi:hypothetical protein
MKRSSILIMIGFGLVLVGVLMLVWDVYATAPGIVWRCYEEPMVWEEDGYWVVECESGNEVMMEGRQKTDGLSLPVPDMEPVPYPDPGMEPYPDPE